MTIASDNNPAGRLRKLLGAIHGMGGSGFDVWAKIFDIDKPYPEADDLKELAREDYERNVIWRVFEVRALVQDVERAISETDDPNSNIYRSALPPIPYILMVDVLAKEHYSNIVSNRITEHLLGILALASEMLSARHSELIISTGDLVEILSDVRTLFVEVQQAKIDPVLKRFILDSLSQIDLAIQKFTIRGPKHFEEALVRIVGELVYLYPDVKSLAAKGPASGKLFDRLITILGRVDSLIRFGETGKKLLSASSFIYGLLGSADTIPPVDLDH